MTLTAAFTNTKVALDRSIQQCEGLLGTHGIREQRYTHKKPLDPDATEGAEAIGEIVYEFVTGEPEAREHERRGVRITVAYQPSVIKIGARHIPKKTKGTTAQMAARALYWFLKAKFDAIDYGIEEFDVAFMPHLVTHLGTTFAEVPELIEQALSRPESIGQLALPAPAS